MVMNPITSTNLPYDARKDFAPISLTAQNTSLLIVRVDGPARFRNWSPRPRGALASLITGPASLRRGSPATCSAGSRYLHRVHPVQSQRRGGARASYGQHRVFA